MRLQIQDTIEVKQNLFLTMRERGKIVQRREGHNIWVDLGREYLASLIAAVSFGPLVTERDDRIQHMGLGIGGNRQLALPTANSPPLSTAYPGTNSQTDTDPTVTTLERPVRISGTTTGPGDPYSPTDRWLGQIQAPATHVAPTEVTFIRLFTSTEVSYSSFTTVPLSEIGLFTSSAAPQGQPFNTLVAYDTFDTLSKTNAFELQVDWTSRF
jgi:hypothetical protein